MVFNTIQFFFFFVVVLIAFHAWPKRLRWLLLLFASYYFYMCWHPWYAGLIAISTFIDYVAGIMIARCEQKYWRRAWLATSLAGNLGILFAFKYFNFFNDSLAAITGLWGDPLHFNTSHLLLPVGISFYTFQSLSYTIDVYRNRISPERHLGIFALYVSFFPQLVAGPIERSETLLPQLRKIARFDYKRTVSGLMLITWGLFKKVVIADRLALVVNSVYSDPSSHNGPAFVIATLFFAYQIYCDFSGYSDIAIGTARILGIDLMKNFDRPYVATSIGDFWRRWHISLSTWFRDYVYIPLGGSRVATSRWMSNLMLTFLISGLWHGANWTFIIWGALHGTFLLSEHLLRKPWEWASTRVGLSARPRLCTAINIGITFCLVNIAWVLFRANTVLDAFHIFTHLHTGWGAALQAAWNPELLKGAARAIGTTRTELIISLLLIVLLETTQTLYARPNSSLDIRLFPAWARWTCYYAAIAAIIILGQFGPPEFIYFQF